MKIARLSIRFISTLVGFLMLSPYLMAQLPKSENSKQPPQKEQSKDPPGLEKSKLRPREGTLKVGDLVPALKLSDMEGKNPVALRELKGKPVVLIFGSCT